MSTTTTRPRKPTLTLKDFAEMAGVKIVRCGNEWGGTWGYTTEDDPNCTVNGFRTELHAYKNWASTTFGRTAAKALMTLLEANS